MNGEGMETVGNRDGDRRLKEQEQKRKKRMGTAEESNRTDKNYRNRARN